MARPCLNGSAKYKLLVRTLRLPRAYVRGLLEELWDTANECGNPAIGSPEAVEASAGWPGEDGIFFAALRDGGWIDQVDGKWVIHDYWDHAPEYVKARLRKEQQRRRGRGVERDSHGTVTGQSRDCPGNVRESIATPAPAPAPIETAGAVCPESAEPTSGPTFPTDGKVREWVLTPDKLQKLLDLFPSLDVRAECHKARAWIEANPTRRKTAAGMARFLYSWMTRAQNNGGVRTSTAPSANGHTPTAAERDAKAQADRAESQREREEAVPLKELVEASRARRAASNE